MHSHLSIQLGLIMSINRHKNTLYLVGVTREPGPGQQWVGRRWCGMVRAGQGSCYLRKRCTRQGEGCFPCWLQAGMRVLSAKIATDGSNRIISLVVSE